MWVNFPRTLSSAAQSKKLLLLLFFFFSERSGASDRPFPGQRFHASPEARSGISYGGGDGGGDVGGCSTNFFL